MANAMPRITIEGDAELMNLISSLPERVLTGVAAGMRKGAKPIIKAAKANLKSKHGLALGSLRKSIGVRALKVDRKKMHVVMFIGPRGDNRQGHLYDATGYHDKKGNFRRVQKKHSPIKIAHLVEFGHRIALSTRGRSEKGKTIRNYLAASVGNVRPRPFLRPAVDANKSNMLAGMKAGLKVAIEKQSARVYAKAIKEVHHDRH